MIADKGFHDLRHHAITEFAESQASDSTIMAIAGPRFTEDAAAPSHVRLQQNRVALDALCSIAA
jgi:glycerol-3-phosphate dehydrogenase